MSRPSPISALQLELKVGTEIAEALRLAHSLAIALSVPVKFEFNGQLLIVTRDDDPLLVYRDWRDQVQGKEPSSQET